MANLTPNQPVMGTVEQPGSGPMQQFYIRMTPPKWTRILLGCNIAVFVLMTLYGFLVYSDLNGTQITSVLVTFGAKVNLLVAQGQVWRLFTAMFIHIGIIHLLFNLYALNILGPLVEGFFGYRRFLLIYILGGLWGSVGSFAFSDALSAGASGAIFALVGAATVYFLQYRENFGARGKAIVQNMFVVIGINLVFGLSMPGIDNWGHIGGLIGGAVVAYGLLPKYQRPAVTHFGAQPLLEEDRASFEWLWTGGVVILLVLAVRLISAKYLG